LLVCQFVFRFRYAAIFALMRYTLLILPMPPLYLSLAIISSIASRRFADD
jgi:hypothetical protein